MPSTSLICSPNPALAMECKAHSLIVHVAVLHDQSALLIKYKDPSGFDNQTGWFLPNDGLHHGEHPDAAARRVLKEQAGINNTPLRLGQVESFIGDDSSWHIVFDYVATPSSSKVTMGKMVNEVSWFGLGKLPRTEDFAHQGWGRGVLMKLSKASRPADLIVSSSDQ